MTAECNIVFAADPVHPDLKLRLNKLNFGRGMADLSKTGTTGSRFQSQQSPRRKFFTNRGTRATIRYEPSSLAGTFDSIGTANTG